MHFWLSLLAQLTYLRPYNSNKFEPRSIPCLFLGYSPLHKGYKCLHLPTNILYISRDVIFNESSFPYTPPLSSLESNSCNTRQQPSLTILIPQSAAQLPQPVLEPSSPHSSHSLHFTSLQPLSSASFSSAESPLPADFSASSTPPLFHLHPHIPWLLVLEITYPSLESLQMVEFGTPS